MKTCSMCKAAKPLDSFGPRNGSPDGRQWECRDCRNAWKRNRSPEVKRVERQRWREANREKVRAHKAVAKALARGDLERPMACERCEAEGPVHAHHADYALRLDVEWLCVACHNAEHVDLRKAA